MNIDLLNKTPYKSIIYNLYLIEEHINQLNKCKWIVRCLRRNMKITFDMFLICLLINLTIQFWIVEGFGHQLNMKKK